MSTIPKPKKCDQNWLEMTPVEGGRICGGCNKMVVDFTKKPWEEIEQIQRENNNSICGMYKPKQLENWGREIPSQKQQLLKAAAITGAAISLVSSSVAQSGILNDQMIITGKVVDEGSCEELPFASIRFIGSDLITETDKEGNFLIIVNNQLRRRTSDSLEINHFGYKSKIIAISQLLELTKGNNILEIEPINSAEIIGFQGRIIDLGGTYFSVKRPTAVERVKWKLKNIFKRREKSDNQK